MATNTDPVISPITVNGVPWNTYEKGLAQVTKNTVDTYDDSLISKIYTMTSFKEREIRERGFTGLTPAQAWGANGQSPVKSSIASTYLIVAENKWVANSIDYTLDMQQNDNHNIMQQTAKDLPLTVMQKRMTDAISFLVGGFTTNWNAEAAEYLFTATHKMDSRYVGSSVSNLVTGGLTISAYNDAVELIIGTPDWMGNPAGYVPYFLLCHETKVTEWEQVLGIAGGYRSDSANFTPNPISGKRRVEIVGTQDPNFPTSYWFLFAQKTGLVFNSVIKGAVWSFTDDETLTTTHSIRSYYTKYARDWRGVVGSTG